MVTRKKYYHVKKLAWSNIDISIIWNPCKCIHFSYRLYFIVFICNNTIQTCNNKRNEFDTQPGPKTWSNRSKLRSTGALRPEFGTGRSPVTLVGSGPKLSKLLLRGRRKNPPRPENASNTDLVLLVAGSIGGSFAGGLEFNGGLEVPPLMKANPPRSPIISSCGAEGGESPRWKEARLFCISTLDDFCIASRLDAFPMFRAISEFLSMSVMSLSFPLRELREKPSSLFPAKFSLLELLTNLPTKPPRPIPPVCRLGGAPRLSELELVDSVLWLNGAIKLNRFSLLWLLTGRGRGKPLTDIIEDVAVVVMATNDDFAVVVTGVDEASPELIPTVLRRIVFNIEPDSLLGDNTLSAESFDFTISVRCDVLAVMFVLLQFTFASLLSVSFVVTLFLSAILLSWGDESSTGFVFSPCEFSISLLSLLVFLFTILLEVFCTVLPSVFSFSFLSFSPCFVFSFFFVLAWFVSCLLLSFRVISPLTCTPGTTSCRPLIVVLAKACHLCSVAEPKHKRLQQLVLFTWVPTRRTPYGTTVSANPINYLANYLLDLSCSSILGERQANLKLICDQRY